jgi:hypothetical protein
MKEIDKTYNPIYPSLDNNVLQNLTQYSNITPKDMLHNMIMTKRDKLLKQHKTPITYLENEDALNVNEINHEVIECIDMIRAMQF